MNATFYPHSEDRMSQFQWNRLHNCQQNSQKYSHEIFDETLKTHLFKVSKTKNEVRNIIKGWFPIKGITAQRRGPFAETVFQDNSVLFRKRKK